LACRDSVADFFLPIAVLVRTPAQGNPCDAGRPLFLITGRDEELQPYEGARVRALSVFTRLRHLYADDAQVLVDIEALACLVHARLAQLDASLQAHRSRGAAAARDAVVSEAETIPTHPHPGAAGRP